MGESENEYYRKKGQGPKGQGPKGQGPKGQGPKGQGPKKGQRDPKPNKRKYEKQ